MKINKNIIFLHLMFKIICSIWKRLIKYGEIRVILKNILDKI